MQIISSNENNDENNEANSDVTWRKICEQMDQNFPRGHTANGPRSEKGL